MAIYSSLDITSPIGTSNKIITEKDFFKSLIIFGGGNVGISEDLISTYAGNLITSGETLEGFPYPTGPDGEYEPNRCLPHFQLSSTTTYWKSRKENQGVPWITTNVIDYTSTSPFGSEDLLTGNTNEELSKKRLSHIKTKDPFRQHVAYYSYLFGDKSKLELTTTDGGLNLSAVKVKISDFKITDSNNKDRILYSGVTTPSNVANGGKVGGNVSPANLYLNKTDNATLRCTFKASANTSTTATYIFNGKPKINLTRVVNGEESTSGFTLSNTNFTTTTMTLTSANTVTLGQHEASKLPVKMALVLNVVRNIDWVIIDLSNLIGKKVYGANYEVGELEYFFTLTEDDLDLISSWSTHLGDFTHRVIGWDTIGVNIKKEDEEEN